MGITLKNHMETLVLQALDEKFDLLGCCKCERCRLDIASYVLNRLPPKYTVTCAGEMFAKLDMLTFQHEADLLRLLFQGAALVAANPRHGYAYAP
ncbi:MAG: late competence development ComFB family protein [Bacillota bacterium]